MVTTLVCFSLFACEAAGASSARHSLRPLNFRWLHTIQISRGSRGEIAEVCCEYPPRHCEERTRRSNPAFLCVGSMDCFACARNDRTKLILRTPSCIQYIRLDGLHPSHLRGGWHIVSGANDVTGGGWCRRRGILRIICAAPHPALRTTLPTKVGGTRKSERHYNSKSILNLRPSPSGFRRASCRSV